MALIRDIREDLPQTRCAESIAVVHLCAIVTLVVIAALGIHSGLSNGTVGYTAVGLAGGAFLLSLYNNERSLKERKYELIVGGCIAAAIIVLGVLGGQKILNTRQLGYGILGATFAPEAIGIASTPILCCVICCRGNGERRVLVQDLAPLFHALAPALGPEFGDAFNAPPQDLASEQQMRTVLKEILEQQLLAATPPEKEDILAGEAIQFMLARLMFIYICGEWKHEPISTCFKPETQAQIRNLRAQYASLADEVVSILEQSTREFSRYSAGAVQFDGTPVFKESFKTLQALAFAELTNRMLMRSMFAVFEKRNTQNAENLNA